MTDTPFADGNSEYLARHFGVGVVRVEKVRELERDFRNALDLLGNFLTVADPEKWGITEMEAERLIEKHKPK